MKPPAFPAPTICAPDELVGHGAQRVAHVLSILDPGWLDLDRRLHGRAGQAAVSGWKTSLRNHADGIVAIDLFVAVTIAWAN